MPLYVVVDSNNHWLYYGEGDGPDQAYANAKEATAYDEHADVLVYEVAGEETYRGKPE